MVLLASDLSLMFVTGIRARGQARRHSASYSSWKVMTEIAAQVPVPVFDCPWCQLENASEEPGGLDREHCQEKKETAAAGKWIREFFSGSPCVANSGKPGRSRPFRLAPRALSQPLPLRRPSPFRAYHGMKYIVIAYDLMDEGLNYHSIMGLHY